MPTKIFILTIAFIASILLTSCKPETTTQQPPSTTVSYTHHQYNWQVNNTAVNRRVLDIPMPKKYTRVSLDTNSFADWLRHLPLKPTGTAVYYHTGDKKYGQRHYAVVDIDTGTKDIQQCADAVMRLKAEYHYSQGEHRKIKFKFISGFTADFGRWSEGYRIRLKNNNFSWRKKARPSTDYNTFKLYLETVFIYANSYSLTKTTRKIKINDIQIGDIFLKGGFPGHAVIIVDMAMQGTNKIFLIAQSYMPAQDIHILKVPGKNSPWHSADFGKKFITSDWVFAKQALRRFVD